VRHPSGPIPQGLDVDVVVVVNVDVNVDVDVVVNVDVDVDGFCLSWPKTGLYLLVDYAGRLGS
jgi:hypothetical protein